MDLIQDLRERTRTLEDQLSIADQIFKNVSRVLQEHEVIDQELDQHMGMFMENNASLLQHRRQEGQADGYEDPYTDYGDEQHKATGFSGKVAKKSQRQQASMRIREGQPQRKGKKTHSQNQSASSIPAPFGVAEYRDPGAKKVRKRRPASPKQQPAFDNSTVIQEAAASHLPAKPKKKAGAQAGRPTVGGGPGAPSSSSLSELQSVEEFRHFLLRNDSQFIDYVNSSLMLSIFDSHLMREGMISMMA